MLRQRQKVNGVNLGKLFTKGRFLVKVTRGSVVFKSEPYFHAIDMGIWEVLGYQTCVEMSCRLMVPILELSLFAPENF